jgi:hypothetical protein
MGVLRPKKANKLYLDADFKCFLNIRVKRQNKSKVVFLILYWFGCKT